MYFCIQGRYLLTLVKTVYVVCCCLSLLFVVVCCCLSLYVSFRCGLLWFVVVCCCLLLFVVVCRLFSFVVVSCRSLSFVVVCCRSLSLVFVFHRRLLQFFVVFRRYSLLFVAIRRYLSSFSSFVCSNTINSIHCCVDHMYFCIQGRYLLTLVNTVYANVLSHLLDPQLTAPCSVHARLLLDWQTKGPPESPWQPVRRSLGPFPAHIMDGSTLIL